MPPRQHLHTARPVARLREGRNDWYRIEAKADDSAAVTIYDEIGWFGVTADDFVRDLRGVKAKAIDLHLNSPGGDVFDGIAIHNALRDHPATVTAYVDGLAASIASVILQAADNRVMNLGGMVMIHEASGLAIGNAKDMRDLAELLDKASQNIADIYAARSGKDAAGFRESMAAETWFTGAEAVAAGLADEAASNGEAVTDEAVTGRWDLSVFSHADRLAARFDPPTTTHPAASPQPDYAAHAAAVATALRGGTK